jgi:hypothetical protein
MWTSSPARVCRADATGDRYAGIERLAGSNLNDTLLGGESNDTVQGLLGDDPPSRHPGQWTAFSAQRGPVHAGRHVGCRHPRGGVRP